MSAYKFNLDLHSSQSQVSLAVKQGDTDRSFEITLSDGGEAFILPAYCVAVLLIKKPYGRTYSSGCIIEHNSVIKFEFDENVTTDPGINICELAVYGADNELIASPSFTMIVSERAVNTEEITVATEDVNKFDEIYSSEATRLENEERREDNEYGVDGTGKTEGRVYAESQREDAEKSRASAEKERDDAEKVRANNEAARKTTFEQKVLEVDDAIDKAETDINGKLEDVEKRYVASEKKRNEDYSTAESNRNSLYETAEYKREDYFYTDFVPYITSQYDAAEAAREVKYNTAEATRNSQFSSEEEQRDASENARKSAESLRVSAETSRVSAESARVLSENNRQSKFSKMESDANKKINEIDNAITNAERRIDLALIETESFDKRISNLEQHIEPKYFVTDETAVYSKQIPTNACPFVEVNKMSNYYRSSKNLLDPALFGDYNAQGQIYFPGDCSVKEGRVILPAGTYTLSSSHTVFIEGHNSEGYDSVTNTTFTLSSEATILLTLAGDFYEWVTPFYASIMLAEGNTALPFENYYKFTSSKITAIETNEPSLFDTAAAVNSNFVKNNDGSFTLTKSGSNRMSKEIPLFIPANTTFSLNAKILKDFTSGGASAQFLSADRSKSKSMAIGTLNQTKLDYEVHSARIFVNSGESDGAYIKFKDFTVNIGASAGAPKATYRIPDALKNLSYYGYGTVDFDNKKFIQEINSSGELITPVETDITSKLTEFDNIIEAEAGGSIKFVNSADAAVPSSITYLLKEGSV
jgi:hypothetical protein